MKKQNLVILFSVVVFGIGCNQSSTLSQLVEAAVERRDSVLLIPGGTYVLDEPLVLSGVRDLEIIGDTMEPVVITSSKELHLDDFTCVDKEQNMYEIILPELKGDVWPDAFRGSAGWPEVSVNGEPLRIARHPNQDYVRIDSVIDRGSVPRQEDSTHMGGRFTVADQEFMAFISTFGDQPLYLGGYWCYKWYDEFIRVDHVDSVNGHIEMAAPHRYGIGGPSGGLFYGINQVAFIDRPGEYSVDIQTGTLRFIMPGETEKDPVIHIAYHDFNLIEMENCTRVSLQGLTLANHNGLAIQMLDCDTVAIRDCHMNNLNSTAVDIRGGSHCGLHKCSITYIGATGVSLQGGNRERLIPSKHYVTQCQIAHFARHIKTYAPGVQLDGVGQYVARCSFADAPHNGILFAGNDHLIVNNLFERVCWDTSNAGAIYCGRDWTLGGTVIRGNSFKDLGQASHHHNWAIYLDDLASGIDVIENIIIDCPSGILVGGGRYNRIIGNTMQDCPRASILYDARGLNWYQPYLQDPEHTLWTRLADIPIDQHPWNKRFPWLMNIAEDDPAFPKYVEIHSNSIINSAEPAIHPTVFEYGSVDLH